MSKKRVSIVFEEVDGIGLDAKGTAGKRFNVFLDGEIDAIKQHIEGAKKAEDLSAAEFWGLNMFKIVMYHISEAGAVEGVAKKGLPL